MTSIRSLLLLLLAAIPTWVDEGQWLPGQIREMDWDALRARGMQLSRDEFWHPEKGGVLSATVQIGGCTASFCSAEGLVVTNHHCGFGAVQKLSTPERNYLRDGYVAATRADELRAEMQVLVVRRIENVTEKIRAVEKAATSDAERVDLIQAETRRLIAEGEKEPDTECSIASFLNGTEYHLYYRTRIPDVRLVYVPPRTIGEFGGDDDNWEWPRHTGDFTFFRAYVGPDGRPRPYAKDNVPYQPAHWLKVSPTGVTEGNLVLVMGYPGRTERYLSSVAVRERQQYLYPKRHDVLTRIIGVLEKAGVGDEAKALELSTTIKSMANSQKNALGMVKGLPRNGTVDLKLREEAEFTKWVAADPGRQKEYGTVLQDLMALDSQVKTTQEKDTILTALLSPTTPLLTTLVTAFDAVLSAKEGAPTPPPLKQQIQAERLTRDLDRVQRPVMAILLDEARRLPDAQALGGTEALRASKAPTDELVAALLHDTTMLDPKQRAALVTGGAPAIQASNDPLVQLARGLAQERRAMALRQKAVEGRRLDVGRKWIAAQQLWRGKQFYPDANSTLRVSIATVRGYAPRDGVVNTPQTTVAGLLAKVTGKDPFDAPPELKTAAKTRDQSRFFDQKLGDVPVCFLSDADTTGGNSGSPIINGRGELVGLNFDRVFENVPGDFGWNAARSRNIGLDVRFILWFVESVVPAPNLVKELLP